MINRLTALFGDQRFIFDSLHNQSPHTICNSSIDEVNTTNIIS